MNDKRKDVQQTKRPSSRLMMVEVWILDYLDPYPIVKQGIVRGTQVAKDSHADQQ